MNQKSNIHAIIIGLLVLCLLLTGGGIFLLNEQINDLRMVIAPTTSAPVGGKIAVERFCDNEAGGTGLCFDYPKSWSVSHYSDSFTSGQKNLEISANAAGGKVTIERLHKGQKGMKGQRIPEYPGLYELGELCSDDDGLTCPQYPYYLTLDGDQTAFAVRVYYRWEDRTEVQPLVNTILYSLEIGP
ncbi:hypothetical protein IT407_03525 [Candidatus Uhrbacteria bacterium]|nr:hypothetical protein [Candidatus Uhrbacteria bacterium]